MDKTTLGNRMKGYEAISKNFLARKTPVIIRVDGRAFHFFTRGLDKPFDKDFIKSMQETMKYLCENIQGCVLGYTQSDEITLVLCDYQTYETDAWFGYNVQKLVSISASMATLAFNREIEKRAYETMGKLCKAELNDEIDLYEKRYNLLIEKLNNGALFDSRAFSLSKEEVCNCLIWRQQDATRNSIQAVGQANFSQKELHKLSCNQIQNKLFSEKGINWNDFSMPEKRGSCCIKTCGKWEIDYSIPIFSEDRDYINSRIMFD